MAKRLYLLGYPIKNAAGPVVMQAACDSVGLDVRSEIWELEDPSRLPEAVRHVRGEEVLGIQVTMPYKVSIIPLIDQLDEEAKKMGAINTIYKEGGKLIGHNTDATGFITSLTREGDFDPKDKRVTILGAGGAARACGFALAKSGVKSITIVNRTLTRRHSLVSTLKSFGIGVEIIGYDDDCLKETIWNSDLLVNSTPFGMKYGPLEGKSPIAENLIQKGQMVYDVVYKPLETPFLKMAKEAGARTLNGLSWSVYSCAASFRLFTHREPSIDAMFNAAQELAREHGW